MYVLLLFWERRKAARGEIAGCVGPWMKAEGKRAVAHSQ